MLAKKRTAIRLLLLAVVPLCHAGCVAMNIPSHRFHDATDRGGLLGHWRDFGRHAGGFESPVAGEMTSEFHDLSMDGGPLQIDSCDPTVDVDGNPKQPEIPWPRFHPVPSRPVFGNISQ